MTGELTPARHVPCAATGCREPGSNPPFDATLVATVTPRPFDLGDRHIRQNQTRPIWEKAYRIAGESQVKACGGRSSSRLGIIVWIANGDARKALFVRIPQLSRRIHGLAWPFA